MSILDSDGLQQPVFLGHWLFGPELRLSPGGGFADVGGYQYLRDSRNQLHRTSRYILPILTNAMYLDIHRAQPRQG